MELSSSRIPTSVIACFVEVLSDCYRGYIKYFTNMMCCVVKTLTPGRTSILHPLLCGDAGALQLQSCFNHAWYQRNPTTRRRNSVLTNRLYFLFLFISNSGTKAEASDSSWRKSFFFQSWWCSSTCVLKSIEIHLLNTPTLELTSSYGSLVFSRCFHGNQLVVALLVSSALPLPPSLLWRPRCTPFPNWSIRALQMRASPCPVEYQSCCREQRNISA